MSDLKKFSQNKGLVLLSERFDVENREFIDEMSKINPKLDYESLNTTWFLLKIAELQLEIDELKKDKTTTNINENEKSTEIVDGTTPTEEQVLKTIFDCVFIRGIDLELYERNFSNEQSGLYDSLVKLFKGNNV